ncbi:HK97-gp10 family putative phage morphogenesis protein [Rhizobium sp.]|uniref:HK97-gp10 family putative phage morphogenesis protein n=1 Tax=Rhizobium sp. TaxID=391 RepID=UPI0034C60C80
MTVTGLDRLRYKLTKKIPDAVRVAVQAAMEQSAEEAVSAMKSLVPVESGDLRESIGWTWGDPPKGSIVIARSRSKSKTGLRITIYAGNDKAYYARWVEFGTAPHVNGGKYAGSMNPGARPHPFFYPGWRMVRRWVKGSVTRSIKKAIKDSSK